MLAISRLITRFALVALVLFASVMVANSQGIVTGSISGTVQDPSGAIVPGATVTAMELTTNSSFRTTTGSAGTFQLPGLPVGFYSVSVEAAGFTPLKIDNVQVQVGTTSPLGLLSLKVGASAEAVTVQASTALLQPDTVEISAEFDTQKTQDLPIGNGFDIVALFTPGVAPSGGNIFTNNNGAEFSTNGIRDRNNNFQLDGQANNDTNIGGPNVFFGNADAIAEVQVITSESAQYGRNSGAVVNYITKAGTNQYHGSAYEFYNGSFADSLANQDKSTVFGYCAPGVSPSTGCFAPKIPRYVDNRWGGTMGGPIARDKLWFFGSGNFEHARTGQVQSSSAPFVTPTPNGISELQAAFPNNPAVGALAAIGPANVKAGKLTFNAPKTINVLGTPIEFATAQRTVSSPLNDYEAMGRVDYQLGAHDRIFGRYIYTKNFTYDFNYFTAPESVTGGIVDVGGPSHYVGADWSHTFNDRLINQVRYSYSHTAISFGGGGFPNCTISAIPSGCPIRVNFADQTDLNLGDYPAWPQGRIIQSSQFQDNATWQLGRNSIKFGGEFDHFPETDFGDFYINGTFTFPNFGAFIQSQPELTQYADGVSSFPLTYNAGALYIQDDIKATPTFTVSVGLRYELQSQPINGLHDLTVHRESNPSTALWDTALPLNLRTVQSLPLSNHNLGPVVGFAWQPLVRGQNELVVRGGFHIGYDATFNNPFANIAQGTPMINFASLQSCTNCIPSDGSAATLRPIINPQVPLGGNPGFRAQANTDPHLYNPYTEQWTLGIQQALSRHMVGELRYLGNHGVGLLENRVGNPALGPLIAAGYQNVIPSGLTPCTTAGAPGATAGFADCNRTDLVTLGNTGYSNYNSLQSRLSIEHWHGVTAGVNFTWSKDIDNISEIYATNTSGNTTNYSQSPFDMSRGERGVSGLDYPLLASIYMLFEVPSVKNGNAITRTLASGWQINPVWRYASGQPYTVVEFPAPDRQLCDPTATSGGTTCRPILTSRRAPIDTVGQCTDPSASDCGLVDFYTGAPVSKDNVHWIVNDDASAAFFGTPFAGGGRNQQRGQTINNTSLAVIKDFKIHDRITIETRGTAYNVLNRQYRGTPGVYIDFGNFSEAGGSFGNTLFNPDSGGQTNSVFSGIDRRRIELGAKVRF